MMQSPSCSCSSRITTTIVIAFILLLFPDTVKAQQEEVLLTLRHPSIGNVYINSYYDYKVDAIFLPVTEIFSLLEINYHPDIKSFSISGNFITPDNPYIINLSAQKVQLGKVSYPLTLDDFRIAETDFYLSPRILEEVFGLNFTVNIERLFLSLETKLSLPVQERKTRELARSRMEGSVLNHEDFPLGYDRKRSLLTGAMMDYSINANYFKEAQGLDYTFSGGMEVLGGDIQGTVYGSNSTAGYNSLHMNNLRWRYAIRDNNYISGIMLGQASTTGLKPVYFKGIALTNDPIEPRQMYETYMIDGTTEPNSEVEMYVNERLTEFKRADELGYYRFDVPITYGTTRISLRIFTPSGQLIVTDRQLQVPFTFLPRGVISYNLQAGRADEFMTADPIQGKWVAHGNVAMGLTPWLTASVGTQFIDNTFNLENQMYYASLSARVAKQYLFNVDAAPDNFYRLTGSVMYANNLSVYFIYTKFDGVSEFNTRGETDNLSANVYLPLNIFGIHSGLRLGGERFILPGRSITNYLTDFSTHLGKMNLRLNYRDNFVTSTEATYFGQGILTTAFTYTIARTPGIPVYARGMYVRAQNQYNVRQNLVLESELELSRTLFKAGRLSIGVAYNHLFNVVNSQVALILDLNKFRSTTAIKTSDNRVFAKQSLSGSIGWDMPNNSLSFNNRQQVGRSAASLLLYVDNDNSGHYDAGDQLLPYRGVKLDRTAITEVGRDSIIRLSQLQSYYKYNLSVNRNAIPDPTLVPLKDKFSFIADPNQYKRIEIPFYRGGTVEGSVLVERDNQTFGQGGLRLNLKSLDTDFSAVIRTMNDGGFYIMDLAPGKYTIDVDSAQLGFLDVIQSEKLTFTIEAKSEGDYKEGLTIILLPSDKVKPENHDEPSSSLVSTPAALKSE